MGVCTSNTAKQNKMIDGHPSLVDIDAKIQEKRGRLDKKKTLAMKDTKGFKKADAIENYYDIQKSIGHGMVNFVKQFIGAFGEVVKAIHLQTNQVRAIKVIEKKKITKHEMLMQLQQ